MMYRFDEEEVKEVLEVLKSGELSPYFKNPKGGKKVQALERAFAEYHGVEHAVAVNSGTAALHTALLALGIGPGDKVITTPYTFIASATSILMCGAEPIFVDIDPRTYNLDPDKIPDDIDYKAIMPVHTLGHPCDMQKIMKIAYEKGAYVIEDNAQSLGARYKGRLTGTFGDISCSSGQFTKTITFGGEGGIILTNDEKLAEKCRQIRSHGSQYQDSPFLTYNFRLSELHAAFGLAQFRKLEKFIDIQTRNAKYIIEHLPKGITPPYVAPDVKHTFYLIGCKYDENITGISRTEFLKRVTEKGINKNLPGAVISEGYRTLVYQKPVLNKYARYCPNAEKLLKVSLWFDIHRWRDLEDVKKDMEIINEVLLG